MFVIITNTAYYYRYSFLRLSFVFQHRSSIMCESPLCGCFVDHLSRVATATPNGVDLPLFSNISLVRSPQTNLLRYKKKTEGEQIL